MTYFLAHIGARRGQITKIDKLLFKNNTVPLLEMTEGKRIMELVD